MLRKSVNSQNIGKWQMFFFHKYFLNYGYIIIFLIQEFCIHLTLSSFFFWADTCRGFKCTKSEFCIDASLKCNGLPNCGRTDDSDETMGCKYLFLAIDMKMISHL